jgi:prevent-host-death family protein
MAKAITFVTTNELRDNLSQAINNAAYGRQPVLVMRRGRKVAAIVSIEAEARRDHERQVAGGSIPDRHRAGAPPAMGALLRLKFDRPLRMFYPSEGRTCASPRWIATSRESPFLLQLFEA